MDLQQDSPASTDFSRKRGALEAAWLLRWNQSTTEAMGALAAVQVDFGWDVLEPKRLTQFSGPEEQDLYLEALLLKQSLLRSQGFSQAASQLLNKVDMTWRKSLERRAPFRLEFELGLEYWRHENVQRACEQFLLAQKKSSNWIEKTFATSNLLWCLEALDLQRDSVEIELQNLLEQSHSFGADKVSHALEQWQAYRARKSFYDRMELLLEPCRGQALFFSNWIKRLPYMDVEDQVKSDNSSAYLWQAPYRDRTLNGLWSPGDKDHVRVGDAVDRLYLWVWCWLADDRRMEYEKLVLTFNSIAEQLDGVQLSIENALLLRNACEWLAFVEPIFCRRANPLLSKLEKVKSLNYAVLQNEYSLIQSLKLGLNRPLTEKPYFISPFERIFQDLVSGRGKSKFKTLDNRLQELRSLENDQRVVLNLNENTVSVPGRSRLQSKPLVDALVFLSQNEEVTFRDLDSTGDIRRVYNLVARIRDLFGDKKILLVSAGRIRKGARFHQFEWQVIQRPTGLIATEKQSEARMKTSGAVALSQAHLTAARILMPQEFGRDSLMACLKLSKATACRVLQDWMKSNEVQRYGHGKNTKYRWVSKKES